MTSRFVAATRSLLILLLCLFFAAFTKEEAQDHLQGTWGTADGAVSFVFDGNVMTTLAGGRSGEKTFAILGTRDNVVWIAIEGHDVYLHFAPGYDAMTMVFDEKKPGALRLRRFD
jgi:hypothetical protein